MDPRSRRRQAGPFFFALLFAIPPAIVRAQSAPDLKQAQRDVFAAFVTGNAFVPVEDPKTGPEDPAYAETKRLAALDQKVLKLQAGTEPSMAARTQLIAEVAQELSPGKPAMPPQDVIQRYLAQKSPAAPRQPSGPEDAARAQLTEKRAAAIASILNGRPGYTSDLTASLSYAGGANAAGPGAAAPVGGRGDSTLPPSFKSDLSRAAPPQPFVPFGTISAPTNTSPVWGARPEGDVLDNLKAYVSDYLSIKTTQANDYLANKTEETKEKGEAVAARRDSACAGGVMNGACVWLATLRASGIVVGSVYSTGDKLTGPDRAVEAAKLTPLALYWDAPDLVKAARGQDGSYGAMAALGLATFQAGMDVLPGVGAAKSVTKGVVKAVVKDEAGVLVKTALVQGGAIPEEAAAKEALTKAASAHAAEPVTMDEVRKADGNFLELAAIDERHSKVVRDLERQLQDMKAKGDPAYEETLARYRKERDVLDATRQEMSTARLKDVLTPFMEDGSVVAIEDADTKALNAEFVKTGGKPPFHEGVPAKKIKTTRDIELCQTQSLKGLENKWFGQWFLPCATDKYFSARQIMDLAALPASNKVEYIARMKIPAGTEMIVGGAAPVRAADSWGVDEFYRTQAGEVVGGGGHGGVVQFWIDPKAHGKEFTAQMGVDVIRMVPVPRSHNPELLELSKNWKDSYGNAAASRKVYAQFRSQTAELAPTANAELKHDFEIFQYFFEDSFKKQFPGEKTL